MNAGRSYSTWNFLEWIRKGMEFWGVINKKVTQFRGSLFWPLYFEGVLHTFMESHLQWPSIFPEFPKQTKKLQWSIYKDIFSTTLLVFFLEQTTDRQIYLLLWVLSCPAYCSGLGRFPVAWLYPEVTATSLN